jgi:hypothetical protein
VLRNGLSVLVGVPTGRRGGRAREANTQGSEYNQDASAPMNAAPDTTLSPSLQQRRPKTVSVAAMNTVSEETGEREYARVPPWAVNMLRHLAVLRDTEDTTTSEHPPPAATVLPPVVPSYERFLAEALGPAGYTTFPLPSDSVGSLYPDAHTVSDDDGAEAFGIARIVDSVVVAHAIATRTAVELHFTTGAAATVDARARRGSLTNRPLLGIRSATPPPQPPPSMTVGNQLDS